MYIKIPDSDSLDTSEITILCWIKANKLAGTWNNIATKWFNPTSHDWYFAIKKTGANYKMNLYTDSDSDKWANTVLTTGE